MDKVEVDKNKTKVTPILKKSTDDTCGVYSDEVEKQSTTRKNNNMIKKKTKKKGKSKRKPASTFFINVKNIDEEASVASGVSSRNKHKIIDEIDDYSLASSSYRSYKKKSGSFFAKLKDVKKRGIAGSKHYHDDMNDVALYYEDDDEMLRFEMNRSEHDAISRPWMNHHASQSFHKVKYIDEEASVYSSGTNGGRANCPSNYHYHQGYKTDKSTFETTRVTMMDVMEQLAINESNKSSSSSGHKSSTALVMQTPKSTTVPARKSMMEVMESLADKPFTVAKTTYQTIKRRGSATLLNTQICIPSSISSSDVRRN